MNIVLLGGNGYVGREVLRQWLEKDKITTFYVLSRSGKNKVESPQVKNLALDVTDYAAVRKALPEAVDIVINFIGGPEKDEDAFIAANQKPAQVTKRIAEDFRVRAIGFIGGKLGPKKFTEVKKELADILRQTGIPVTVVEPTLIYGADRNDLLSKLVPVFQLFGLFSVNFKPVRVEKVAAELIAGLTGGN